MLPSLYVCNVVLTNLTHLSKGHRSLPPGVFPAREVANAEIVDVGLVEPPGKREGGMKECGKSI